MKNNKDLLGFGGLHVSITSLDYLPSLTSKLIEDDKINYLNTNTNRGDKGFGSSGI